MGKQKLKGLWIPAEILLNADLSDKEKIVLSMILYLSFIDGLKNQVQHYTLIKNIVINNCISCFESVNTRNVAKRIRLCRGAT